MVKTHRKVNPNPTQINACYFSDSIELFAEHSCFDVKEYGDFTIGEFFLVLKHQEKDITISYMMDGCNGNGKPSYRCVYSDLD